MKIFLWLLIILLVGAIIALLGNALRCMSANGDSCPAWCQVKKTRCLSSVCEAQLTCQGQGLGDYVSLIDRWWEESIKR